MVGPGGTATVEKLVAAVVDSGGCSRWCSVEAGDRLPVSEENLSARPMCPGGHIFLGNFVLPDRIYCPF